MEWQEIYKSKLVSAEEAVKQVKSGDMVVPGHNCAEPRYLMKVLCETRGMELENVGILQGLNVGEAPYADPKYHGHFVPVCYFLGKNTRACVQEGRGEFLPMHFYAQPKAMRDKKIGCDVTMLYCTPPDESGYVNLGTCCDQAKACIETARVSICQVNRNMPYVCGDTMVHVSDIDFFVEHDEDIYAIDPISSDDPVVEKIGYNIAQLIEDGSCLQMGQGGVPNAILKFLGDKKDLGVHTEVFTDNLIPLIKAGVVNGKRKNINKGKIVATFVQGTKELYRYVDHNNLIELKPVDYTNDVGVIAQNDKVVAICSALEVDCMGQVNADTRGTTVFSGVGGQLDFMRGAEQSKGGKPIIALPSTAKHGEVSRIVACLGAGTPVTTTRQDVHWVVTEYGAVDLFGMPIKERAKALISIAHPKFREQLEKDWEAYCRNAGMLYL